MSIDYISLMNDIDDELIKEASYRKERKRKVINIKNITIAVAGLAIIAFMFRFWNTSQPSVNVTPEDNAPTIFVPDDSSCIAVPEVITLDYPEDVDNCIYAASNIFFATCTGEEVRNNYDYVDVKFDVLEDIKGETVENSVWVRFFYGNDANKYNWSGCCYKGIDYVLVTNKKVSVYEESDIYYPVFCEDIYGEDIIIQNKNVTPDEHLALVKEAIQKVLTANDPANIKYADTQKALASASNVVVAKYTGREVNDGEYIDLILELSEELKGSNVTKEFGLRMEADGRDYSDKSYYNTERDYIIALENIGHDKFLPLYSQTVPWGVELAGSEIHTSTDYIIAFKKRVANLTDNQSYDYIHSEKWSDIVDGSDYLAIIEPNQNTYVSPYGRTESFECGVIQTLKGEILEGKISINLLSDQITLNDKYLVLLNKTLDGNAYILSSKKSLLSLEDEENVDYVKSIIETP